MLKTHQSSKVYVLTVLFLTLVLISCGAKPSDVASVELPTGTPSFTPTPTPVPSPLVLPTLQPSKELMMHNDMITQMVFSPNGQMLAYITWDPFTNQSSVKLWDVESRQDLHTFNGHTDYVADVAFSSDGKILASGSYDNTVILWNVVSGQKLRVFTSGGQVQSVVFSPDGKTLASDSSSSVTPITLWNIDNGQVLQTLKDDRVSDLGNYLADIALSPDGTMVASASTNGMKLWNWKSGEELRTLTVEPVWLETVAGI
jgi:WD40 repeat protein